MIFKITVLVRTTNKENYLVFQAWPPLSPDYFSITGTFTELKLFPHDNLPFCTDCHNNSQYKTTAAVRRWPSCPCASGTSPSRRSITRFWGTHLSMDTPIQKTTNACCSVFIFQSWLCTCVANGGVWMTCCGRPVNPEVAWCRSVCQLFFHMIISQPFR